MSSEREKLIEIWLDSAGERQYQFAFRNALLWAGHTILHDTSHTALELGKDIIARSPMGDLFAYQLKGNPGSRITIAQWQSLIPQIQTLVYQPVMHPAVRPGTPHIPVLVTNGEIHEDVYAAISGFNHSILGPNAQPLQVITRGPLLKQVIDAADTLWPISISAQRNVLNIYASNGDDEAPLEEFIPLLANILTSNNYNHTAIPAAHLLVSILSSHWIESKNYYELIKMYSLLAVHAICYQSQWKRSKQRDEKFVEEIVANLKSHIYSFARELATNYKDKPLINRDTFSEFSYYHPRKKIISGILAAAILDKTIELDDSTRDFIWDFVCKEKHSSFLLWEGIIPFCLAEFWAMSNIQGTIEPHRRLFALVNGILQCNRAENPLENLPGPYYSLGQVVEHKYGPFLGVLRSEIDMDSHRKRSWFAEPLFFMLARRNYKSWCQLLWPELTRFLHCRTRLKKAEDFVASRSETAVTEDTLIDVSSQKTWDDVIEDAKLLNTPLIPEQLRARPSLVLLYCMFAPQRMDRDVILWLDRQFCHTWH
ncbi:MULTISPECIES: hypothetical protein [unclassified Bradyrhizobium]|uniref:hypothetical protein n=1 Tax=unclassified Bradyrhizobium TaxID=2631580 RepID=UPI002916DE3A|nr:MULTISPECIES: hypothetical protein [unclassified Bradyrhizobium]